jgi:hypothetical protein
VAALKLPSGAFFPFFIGAVLNVPAGLDHLYFYKLFQEGSFVRSSVPIEKAGVLLDRQGLDLIISEPHKKTILKQPSAQNKPVQELGWIRTVSDVHRLSHSLNQLDYAA